VLKLKHQYFVNTETKFYYKNFIAKIQALLVSTQRSSLHSATDKTLSKAFSTFADVNKRQRKQYLVMARIKKYQKLTVHLVSTQNSIVIFLH